MVSGILGEPGNGGGIGRILQDGFHVSSALSGLNLRHLLVVRAGHVVQLHGKFVLFEAAERVSQVINRIVGTRKGAVSTRIRDRELKVGIELLGGIDFHHERLAFESDHAAAIGVEDEVGVDEFALVLQKPIHAVGLAAFFVRGEGEDNVTVRDVTFLLKADERGAHDGVAVFHVLGATAVEVSVFLNELKGIGGPVFAAGLDHVEVTDKQDGLVLSGAVQARDHVLLAVVGANDLDVTGGEPGVAETLRHRLGGGGHIADRIGGIDFDQLLEDVVGKLPGRIIELGLKINSK